MSSFINGKVALVTGGVSGIGLTTVKEFLKNGLKGVILADVDVVKGEAAVRTLSEEFGPNRVVFIRTDVQIQEEVEAAFEKAIETFKNLDIIVNSAGICHGKAWEREISINLAGTIRVMLLGFDEYLPKYKTGAEAVIVNMSSLTGLVGMGVVPTYAATKHAIIGLSKSYADKSHYERTKIRVLTMCPGSTATPINDDFFAKCLGPNYAGTVQGLKQQLPKQPPEAVANGIIKAIEEGDTGSIWIVHDGRTFEHKILDLPSLLELHK